MTPEQVEQSNAHQMALKGIPWTEIAHFLIDCTSARAVVEVMIEDARDRGEL